MSDDLNNLLENLKEDPSPSTYYAVVEFYKKEEDYDNALKYADECLSEFPNNLKVSLSKGKILIEQNKLDEARDIFEKIVEKRTTHYMANQQLAKIYKMQGDYEKALEHLNILVDENPDDDLINEEIAEIKNLMKNNANKPEEAEIYTVSNAKVYEEKGDIEKAKEIYSKVLENDPDNAEAKSALEKLSPTEVPEQPKSEIEDKFTDLFEEGEIEEPETEEENEDLFSEENKEAEEFEDIFDSGKDEEENKENEKAEETFSNIFEEDENKEDESNEETNQEVPEASDDLGDIFGESEESKEEASNELDNIFGESEEEEVAEEKSEAEGLEDIFGEEEQASEGEEEKETEDEAETSEEESQESEAEGLEDIFSEEEQASEGEEEKKTEEEQPVEEEPEAVEEENPEENEENVEETSTSPEEQSVFDNEELEETPSEFTEEEEEKDDTLKNMFQSEVSEEDKNIFEENKNEKTEIAEHIEEKQNDDEEIENVFDQAFEESEGGAEDETMDMFAAGENEPEEEASDEETVIYSSDMKPGETLEKTEEPVEELQEEALPEEAVESEQEEELETESTVEEKVEEEAEVETPVEEKEEEVEIETHVESEKSEEGIKIPETNISKGGVAQIPVYLANKIDKSVTSIDEFLNYILGFEGINGVYIVSEDGLLISGKPEEPAYDINEFSATSAEIIKKIKDIAILININELDAIEMDFEKGKLFVQRANAGFVFIVSEQFVMGNSLMPILEYLINKAEKDGIL